MINRACTKAKSIDTSYVCTHTCKIMHARAPQKCLPVFQAAKAPLRNGARFSSPGMTRVPPPPGRP